MNPFSKNLKFLMKKLHYKNVTLAEKLGVTKSTISNYLSGTSMPRNDTLIKLTEVLFCTVEMLTTMQLSNGVGELREGGCTFNIFPLFAKQLRTFHDDIYIPENFVHSFYFPTMHHDQKECYAVQLYDNDSLQEHCLPTGSIALFERNKEVANGDIAAVYFKKLQRILMRKIEFKTDSITLSSDTDTCTYTNAEKDTQIQILGKMVTTITFHMS